GNSRRHLRIAAGTVLRRPGGGRARRERRGEDRRVGDDEQLPRHACATDPCRDLRRRRTRPGHAVGGRPSDPQHDTDERNGGLWVTNGFVAPVHVRWSDIDMYQHINHATMVTPLEGARIPFLREPFGPEIETIGLLIADVNISYK